MSGVRISLVRQLVAALGDVKREATSLRLTHSKSEDTSTPWSDDRIRRWMRWAMAIFYLAAGVIHLQSPDAFLPIMPDWVPAPREVILFTGACEIAGALGLVTRPFRWWAAVMLGQRRAG
jgi:DoxX-like family